MDFPHPANDPPGMEGEGGTLALHLDKALGLARNSWDDRKDPDQ